MKGVIRCSLHRPDVSWEKRALEAVGFLVSHNGSNFTWGCLKKAYLFTVFTYRVAVNHSGNISLCHAAELFYGFLSHFCPKTAVRKKNILLFLVALKISLVYLNLEYIKANPQLLWQGGGATFTQCR